MRDLFVLSCYFVFAPAIVAAQSSEQYSEPASAVFRIAFLGDSLTAGYGLPADFAFPSVVQKRLQEKGHTVDVLNAGVSGDTSAGGRRRVQWVLKRQFDLLVVSLGANDALRGLPVADTRENLRAIIRETRVKHPQLQIILAGMQAPPSMGEQYKQEFDALYQEVARETNVQFLPFLLEGVAGNADLNLPDRIHPNEKGQQAVAALLLPLIEKALTRARKSD